MPVYPGAPTCRFESFPLHVEISLDVHLCGLQIHMSEEILDHDKRNARLEQVHALAVSQRVRADPRSRKIGDGACGSAEVFEQDVSSTVPTQSGSAPVLQEWL